MKTEIRVIKTQQDYDAAIVRLSSLMDEDFAAGSTQDAELELLALVIESYEKSIVAPVKPDPIEAILFRMDQQKLSKKDLIPYFGTLSKVSEVLARKRPLSLSMIRKLYAGLNIPAETLISGSGDDDLDLNSAPKYDYLKFPLQEMLERNFFDGFVGDIKRLKEYAEDQVSKFMFGIKGESLNPAMLRAPQHQNGSKLMDHYALLIWQIAVIRKARNQKLSTQYKKGIICDDWLRDLVKLSRFDTGPQLAKEFLADSGIRLVIEKHFKKTYLDGAAMLDGDYPIVALTLRHDRIDNFWFALTHELIHVQRHLVPDKQFIFDNLDDKTRVSKEELEADELAKNALIPLEEWNASEVKFEPTVKNLKALAEKLRIHHAIVAGRVRHEQNNWRIFTGILGKYDVSRCFESQSEGFEAISN